MKKKTGKRIRSAALLLAFVLLSGSARPVCVRAMLTEEEQIANKKKKEKKAQAEAKARQTGTAQSAAGAQAKAPDAQQTETETQTETKAADAQTETKVTDAQNETQAQTGKAADAQQTETETETPQTETEAPQTEAETETPQTEAADGPLIAIDPGHQAPGSELSGTEPNGPGSETEKDKTAPGTKGVDSGVEEYELDLDISLQLEKELTSRGYRVILTRREHDVSLSNIDRCEIANEAGADILLHIHANTIDDAGVSGAVGTVPSESNPYIGELYDSCMTLSDDILRAYCRATGLKNNGSWRSDNMASINWSEMPVAILELGYMSNPGDDAYITDPGNWESMAEAIADGIDEYFGR